MIDFFSRNRPIRISLRQLDGREALLRQVAASHQREHSQEVQESMDGQKQCSAGSIFAFKNINFENPHFDIILCFVICHTYFNKLDGIIFQQIIIETKEDKPFHSY